MTSIESIRSAIPELAKDIKLNLQSVLQGGALSAAQRWGVAVASAMASRNPCLCDAVIALEIPALAQAVVEPAA